MTTMLKFASAAAALVVLFAVAQGALAEGPLVQTKQGPVQGVSLPGVDVRAPPASCHTLRAPCV